MERNSNTLLLHELEGLVPVLSRLGARVAELGESRILTAILTLETTLHRDLPELWTTELKSRTNEVHPICKSNGTYLDCHCKGKCELL
jgi:hypothetical protein